MRVPVRNSVRIRSVKMFSSFFFENHLKNNLFTFGRGSLAVGRHMEMCDIDKEIQNVDLGTKDHPKTSAEQVKLMEKELGQLKTKLNKYFNGPQHVIKKMDLLRKNIRELNDLEKSKE